MKSGRLWEIFEQLSSKEIREIEKCVKSPIFNNRKSVESLFEFLRECRDDLKIIPDKAQIHHHVFPGEQFEDIRVRNAMSFLLKIIERWFVLKEIEADSTRTSLALASVYRKKQLLKHYNQTIRANEKLRKSQPLRHADYYVGQYRLEFEKYRFHSSRRELEEINLQSLSDNLDISYLAQKLRQTCFSVSLKRVHSTEYDSGLLPYLLEISSTEKYQSVPAIALYYHGYFALVKPEEEQHFQAFKNLLSKYQSQFPKQELRDLYLLATNYCIRHMNKNAQQYMNSALELYREGLENKALLVDGVLLHFTFSNIVAFGIVKEDYEFVENFLNEYKSALSEEYREPIYAFNLARLRYHLGDFEEALPLLQREIYRDLLLNLSAKTLTAKIFYESEEYNVLSSHLDAMQQFIRRKKVIGYHRENFQNFISFLRKIVELPSFDKEKKAALKKEVLEAKAVVERKWLSEQL